MQQNLQRENCVNWCKKCNVCFDVSASEIGLLLIDSGPSFSFSEAMHCVSWWSQLSSRFLAIRCHFRTSAECKAVESKLSSALAIDILYIEWKYSRTFKDNPDCKRTVTIFTVFMVCPSEAFNQGTGRNERLLGSLRAKSVQRARHTFKEKRVTACQRSTSVFWMLSSCKFTQRAGFVTLVFGGDNYQSVLQACKEFESKTRTQ
jgi:hypothetical protein